MENSDADEPDANEFDVVKFLWERAAAEARLLYQRNNAVMAIESVSFAFWLRLLENFNFTAYFALSVFAFCLSVFWYFVNRSSRYLNHVYLEDAQRILESKEGLKALLESSMNTPGLKAQSNFGPQQWLPSSCRIDRWSPGDWFLVLPILSGVFWGLGFWIGLIVLLLTK